MQVTKEEQPWIVAFVADLFFSTRIEDAGRRLGYAVVIIEDADQIGPADSQALGRQFAEHLIGRGAALIDQLTQWKPGLIIFDLGNTGIPWREWIPLITSVPATRRFPVLCFGSHIEVETMRAAKEAGAQEVVARSRFVSDLQNLIRKHIHVIDHEVLRETCQEPLSAEAIRGLEEFNRGEYFEAHESLEHAWMDDSTPGRELYRAVLQVAVAYYQIKRGNYNGAAKMFLRVRQWIEPLPDKCRGVDVAQLRYSAERVHEALLALGPERIGEFDQSLLKPVKYAC
jgi:predicted metal-dependent hydrolase